MKYFLILLTSLLLSCSPKVIHFINDSAPFAKYKSYAVINTKSNNTTKSSDTNDLFEIIEESIVSQMNRRGYIGPKSVSDVVIRYELIRSKKTVINNVNPIAAQDLNFIAPLSTTSYIEGVLLVEMIDISSKKTVWQASLDLGENKRRQGDKETIDMAVSKIFDTFLYKAGSNQINEAIKENK